MSMGTLNASIARLLPLSLCTTRPSGDPTSSNDDIELTKRLAEAD
ncbi:MAG: hypothetical protein QME59_02160 [Candidatus Hydrothermarchaeota archaeon]|nr:hypothetical protein [Candidatus Hydrothermarchaeota archaeon]